ncbi:MAG: hypothetical protein V4724_18880 [Pseudomonadota bacterium]
MSKALRINFELDRPDNPPLYDELARFSKGTKRVNRLRTLAHAGLIAQICTQESINTDGLQKPADNNDPARSAATLELFGPSAS